MSEILKNLNEIPVKTFRWLGINNLSLKDLEIPEVLKLSRNYSDLENDNYDLIYSHKKSPELLELKNETFGISNEIIKEINENYNLGFFLNIKKPTTEPIIINFEFDKNDKSIIDNNLIIADENSEATVVLNYSSFDESLSYHNGLIKIIANKNSKINVFVIQKLNNNSINLNSALSLIREKAEVNYSSIDLGSKYSISSYNSFLNENEGLSNLDSLYLGENEKIIDVNYSIIHKGKETKSEINAKGALLGKSKKIFRGTLDFRKGSSKSVGKEEEYVMLLSPNVKNSSIPLLLSREDDIQGEHAASAGKIDESTLFYLMSRGLSVEESRKLLILAHFTPLINKLPADFRDDIIATIERKLKNE